MDWSYEGRAQKFGQGLGRKCPVTHALGRSALSATIRRPRGAIKICHYFKLLFNCLRSAFVALQSNSRKRYGCIIPRVLILVTTWGLFSGHRIVAIAAKRVASAQAPHDQCRTFDPAVFLQRLECIGRASGLIPAIKPHPGAKK